MERRRGWQRPFKRGGARAPRSVGRPFLAHERMGDAEEEHERAKSGNIGAERRYQVPAGESVGVIGDAARHASETEEMLREEDDIHTDEREPEVQLPMGSE